ncbi:polyphosphate polymerase domain-containing protein [Clostridium cylindrosporum]|uniref:VTC domain-containing protein n=1 Tax=Clostridium cylindrosporum DSM 605 TaxID=1121307 RepID=A0A0J8D8L4_CLOCY|nr:polyphosphate polymerase domain-containing protein [Clostridium cylindrosporum]KMT22222.1 hypothetical protein CLCY_4c01950 [Clostridium cylindrosporum DSM 605]
MLDYKKYENSKAVKVSRREMKYFITLEDYYYFKSVFPVFFNKDLHSIDEGYRVRSVYFDSINNLDYHDKIEGEQNRKKIRIRVYNPNDNKAKLEVKYKFNLNQRKETLIISREHAKRLINGEYDVLLNYSDGIALKIYAIMVSDIYKPVSTLEYKREAFYKDEYGIRVTLDTEISHSETEFDIFSKDLNMIPTLDINRPLLEVKYEKYLYKWFQDILSSRDCVNSSISKYCSSRKIYGGFHI